MRAVLVVACLLVCASALAQSSKKLPEIPREQRQPAPAAPSPQPPIQVTIQTPEPNPQIAKDEAADRKANLEIQDTIGKATIAMAVIALVQVAAGIMAFVAAWKAAKAAETSSNAAERSVALARAGMAFTISQKRIADRQLRIQMQQLALENRGYVHIGGLTNPSFTDQQTNLFFALSNSGKTPITIERGEFRLSIDNPVPFKDTFKIEAQTIGPNEKPSPTVATFGAAPAEYRAFTYRTGMQPVFLSADVWYRDAFPDTPLHHKRFGVKFLMDGWYPNQAVPNDEIDAPQEQPEK